jgi:hypothetical protein
MHMRLLIVAVMTSVLGACSNSTSSEATAVTPPPSQTTSQQEVGRATLKIGQTISIGDLRLTFRSVEGDSRCAIDVVCVWAGDAEIALSIEQGGKAAVAALHTTLEPKKTEWNGYTISLVSVAPSRRAGTAVDPADYRAEIVVTR